MYYIIQRTKNGSIGLACTDKGVMEWVTEAAANEALLEIASSSPGQFEVCKRVSRLTVSMKIEPVTTATVTK